MQITRLVPLAVFLSALAPGQSTDTGTGHRVAGTALLNSNNTGASRIFALPGSHPPGAGCLPAGRRSGQGRGHPGG